MKFCRMHFSLNKVISKLECLLREVIKMTSIDNEYARKASKDNFVKKILCAIFIT